VLFIFSKLCPTTTTQPTFPTRTTTHISKLCANCFRWKNTTTTPSSKSSTDFSLIQRTNRFSRWFITRQRPSCCRKIRRLDSVSCFHTTICPCSIICWLHFTHWITGSTTLVPRMLHCIRNFSLEPV